MSLPPEEPACAPSRGMSGRRIITILGWLTGAAVLAGVIWFIGWEDIRAVFTGIEPRLFAVMVVLDGAAMWVRAVKWRLVLGKNQNAFGVHFLSKVAGNYSPGRVGELSPLLLKAHRNARLGAWIVVDRLLEMAVTIVFGALGFLMLRFSSARVIPALAGAVLVFIILPLVMITRGRWLETLAAKSREGSRFRKALGALVSVSEEVGHLRSDMPLAGMLTVAGTLLELAAYILLFRSFGVTGVTFALVAAAKCAQGVVGALPFTPGPTGLPHLAAGVFLHQAGGLDSGMLAAAMGSREVVVNLLFWSFLALTSPGFVMRRRA